MVKFNVIFLFTTYHGFVLHSLPFFFCLHQEIDHISYVRQAFEAGSLRYCLEILECDILKDYDVRHLNLGSITCCSGLIFFKP